MRRPWPVWILICIFPAYFLASCGRSPEATSARHIQRGDEYVKEEKFREAVIEYRNAVKALPKDPGAHWKLAKAAIKAKDFGTAFTELRDTVELDPANFEALGKLGEIYVMVGKMDEAVRIADRFAKQRPSDPQGYILQAGVSIRRGNLDEAIGKLKKASELDPGRSHTMLSIANLLLVKNDRTNALAWYDKALALDPDSVEVHVARGNFFFAVRNLGEGEKEYRKAIGLSKDKENLRIALAENYLQQGRMEDSEKELLAVIKDHNSQRARKALAEITLDSGKAAEAKPIVDAILRENGKDLDGKYLQGRIALAENRLDDAKNLFSEVLRDDKSMAGAHLYNGLIEIRRGQIDIGREEVAEAIRLDPLNSRAQLVFGEISLRSGSPADAEKAALNVLKHDPSNGHAGVILGDSYLAMKEWAKAERIYRSMIRQLPGSGIGYMKMGISLKQQGKPREAAAWFAKGVENNPRDLALINEYVFALLSAKEKEKAKKVLDDAIAGDPKNGDLWDLAGRFNESTGKPAEAESAFLKAIDLKPDIISPYLQLGLIYTSQKKFADAEVRLRKVVEKDDRNIGAHALLGMVLNARGNIDASSREYRRTLQLSPRNALAANNLASNLLEGGGNLDEAMKFAQTAREASPEDPNVSDTLGWVYYRKGLFDLAYPLLSEASVKLKASPVIRYHHGMVLLKRGARKEAAVELKTALSMDPNFNGSDEARKALDTVKSF